MRQLMVSLDKKILDPNSAVARRMIEYGKENELFIIIPSEEKKSFDLSDTVHVQSTGGKNKITQLFNLYWLGDSIFKKRFNNLTIEQFITVQDPFFTGLVGWCLKKRFRVKLEIQMHGDFFGDYYKKQWLRLCLAEFVLKRTDVIRVAGERIKQNLTKFNKIDGRKIVVRPIAVDVEKIKNYQPKIDLRQKYPGYEKIFLVLGRLDPVKNIVWLIEVFKEVVKQKSKYLLLIVGGGTEEQSKMFNVQCSMFHKNITLEPWTTDPISYLKTADGLLFPSLSEGYGLVAMEANAAGCSVIMNDVGVANYELKSSDKVKILPINNREAWIEAILSV